MGATLGNLAYKPPPPPPPLPEGAPQPSGTKPAPPKVPPPKAPQAASVPGSVRNLPGYVQQTYATNFPEVAALGPAQPALGHESPLPSGYATAPPRVMDKAWANWVPTTTPPGARLGMAMAQLDPTVLEAGETRRTPMATPSGPQWWGPGPEALERRVLERLGEEGGGTPASSLSGSASASCAAAAAAAASDPLADPPLIAALNHLALASAQPRDWFDAWELLRKASPADIAAALPPSHRTAGWTALHVAAFRCSV